MSGNTNIGVVAESGSDALQIGFFSSCSMPCNVFVTAQTRVRDNRNGGERPFDVRLYGNLVGVGLFDVRLNCRCQRLVLSVLVAVSAAFRLP